MVDIPYMLNKSTTQMGDGLTIKDVVEELQNYHKYLSEQAKKRTWRGDDFIANNYKTHAEKVGKLVNFTGELINVFDLPEEAVKAMVIKN